MEQKTEETWTITVDVPVNMENVKSEICSAWEGGSVYWVSDEWTIEAVVADGIERGEGKDYEYQWELPFLEGCAIIFIDNSGWIRKNGESYRLDIETIKRGCVIYAKNYPHFIGNITNDYNGDADSGDVFLQCCLFGEVVFG